MEGLEQQAAPFRHAEAVAMVEDESGGKPSALQKLKLCAADVRAVGGADFEDVAFFHEEGDLHCDAGLESGGFGGVVGGVAFDTLRRFGDGELNIDGEVDRDGCAFKEEHFDFLTFFEVVLGVAHEGIVKGDGLVGAEIHEVEASRVGVGELKLLTVGLDDLDFVGGGEADGLLVSVVKGADGGGDQGIAFAGGAVLETENDSAITFVFNTLPFFEIGCDDCHVAEG